MLRYQTYGLSITSDLYLPELEGSEPATTECFAQLPQVAVCVQPVPIEDGDPEGHWFFVRQDGTVVLRLPRVASFAIRREGSIRVEPVEGADPAEVRAYLLGSAFGILLHQREELPLHVGAVAIGGQAWAFTAASGTGKSTLVAGLHYHAGLPLFADDVAVLRPGHRDGGAPDAPAQGLLWPGPPVVKLLPDALEGLDTARMELMPEYRDSLKQRVRFAGGFVRKPLPLAGLIVLERSSDGTEPGIVLDRCGGAEAFLEAQTAIYRFEMGIEVASMPVMFRGAGWLASSVPIYRGRITAPDPRYPGVRERAICRALETLAGHA